MSYIPTNPLQVSNGGTGSTIGNLSKLQKIAGSYQSSNLITNPANSSNATITSPASAPSTTGYTNVMVGTSGFITSITGTLTAGSSVVTSLSSTTGLIAGQWAVEAGSTLTFPTHLLPGTQIQSINTVASMMSLTKPAIAGGAITIRIANNMVNFISGVPFDYSNNLVLGGSQTTSASPAYTSAGTVIEFETDSANFSLATILLKFFQNGASPNSYRVAIDGVYNNYTPQAFGASEWLSIVFPEVAISGPHTVRVELPALIAVQQIWVPAGASIYRYRNPVLARLSLFGDSYMYAGVSGQWPQDSLAARVANMLGCLYDVNSVAGTGYINNGGTNYPWSAPQRTNNVAYRNYDAIIVFGSVNDGGQTAVAEQAAALTTWQGLRTNAPSAPIFIFGVPTTGNISSASATILENGLASAFIQWGDPNSWYFPVTTDPNGAWFNSNNLSTYIGADSTHPTDPQGYSFLADKVVQAIKSVLQTNVLI